MRGLLFSAGILGLLVGLYSPAMAQQVMIAPGSLVFADGDRGGQFFVANTSNSTNTYRVEPAYFAMKEDGRLVEVLDDLPPNSALDMLRYSPRQFQLRPGESQTVRLAVRKPATLAADEYRGHLRVVNLGSVSDRPSVAESDGSFARVSIRVARAVRILVRQGVGAADASLGEVSARKADTDLISLSFQLHKAGKGSSRGQYALFARDRSNGATVETFLQSGVLVYSELSRRQVTHAIPADRLTGAMDLCVSYRNTEGARNGKSETRCVDPGAL